MKTRHTTKCKATKRDETFADTSGFTGSSQYEGACYWQNEHIQVHVDILNIISGENTSLCVCVPTSCVYEKTAHQKLLSSPDTQKHQSPLGLMQLSAVVVL